MRTAEVAGNLLLCVFALILADDKDPLSSDSAEAGYDSAVVAETPVAVQLAKIVNHQVEIVGKEGSIGMASDLDGLPSGQVRVDSLQLGDLLALELANFSGITDSLDRAKLSKLGNLAVDVGYLLLEVQVVGNW
jgi:hypothetical protein